MADEITNAGPVLSLEERISLHCQSFEKLFTEAAQWRASVWEGRARDSEKQFEPLQKRGQSSDGQVKQQAQLKSEYNSTDDNITRPAVRRIAGRGQKMLFPTNEDNWDLTPSPVPDLARPNDAAIDPRTGQAVMGPDGMPLKRADVRAAELKVAERKCQRMRQYIRDDFANSKYNEAGRQIILDACRVGPGVLHGPFKKATPQTVGQSAQGFGFTVDAAVTTTKISAAVERIDPWTFFPQPALTMSQCEHVTLASGYTRRDVLALKKQPGFNPDQIDVLLAQEPQTPTLGKSPMADQSGATLAGRYFVKRYFGPIPRDVFDCIYDAETIEKMALPPESIDGEVWYCQGVILKAAIFLADEGQPLPFYVFTIEDATDSLFGLSVPDIIRGDQTDRNQAWHAVKLNAFRSAAPITVVLKGALVDENGRAAVPSFDRPRTLVVNDESIQDVRQAITEFIANNNIEKLLEFYDRTGQNADNRLLMPFVSEERQAPETRLGVYNDMMASNVVQAAMAKSYDDNITTDLVDAMVKWHMRNNDDPDCKGDFQPVARGATDLLDKEIKLIRAQEIVQLSADPRYAAYFDSRDVLEAILSLSEMHGIKLKSDDEVAAAAQQQQDPEAGKLAIQKEIATERNQTELQIAQIRAQADVLVAQYSNRTAMAQLASDEKVSLAEVAGKLDMHELDTQVAAFSQILSSKDKRESEQKQLDQKARESGAKVALEAEKMAAKERENALEVRVESPNPRLQ